jgi:RIO kinase 1
VRERASVPELDHFLDEGLISQVIRPLRSGKEASVYLCRAVESNTGHRLLAAKVYHPSERRNFHDRAVYEEGQRMGKHRERRAIANHTRFGKQAEQGFWVYHEHAVLTSLSAAGAPVPRPVALGGNAILMEFIAGPDGEAAPQLRHVVLDRREAEALLGSLIRTMTTFLRHNVVHADLSAYNVLYDGERATIIDLPQAVDPRANRSARELLGRDVRNVVNHLTRFGVVADAERIAEDLWTGFLFADLWDPELALPPDLVTGA